MSPAHVQGRRGYDPLEFGRDGHVHGIDDVLVRHLEAISIHGYHVFAKDEGVLVMIHIDRIKYVLLYIRDTGEGHTFRSPVVEKESIVGCLDIRYSGVVNIVCFVIEYLEVRLTQVERLRVRLAMVDAVVGDDDRFAGLHGIHRAVAGDGDNSTYRHGFAHDVRGVVLFGNRQEF